MARGIDLVMVVVVGTLALGCGESNPAQRDADVADGMPSGAGGSNTGGVAQDATTSGSGASDGSDGAIAGVSCDPRRILCKRVAPTCAEGQVPSVEGSCFGPCVKIETCVCTTAAECPGAERYTCHMSARHCGPYLN